MNRGFGEEFAEAAVLQPNTRHIHFFGVKLVEHEPDFEPDFTEILTITLYPGVAPEM